MPAAARTLVDTTKCSQVTPGAPPVPHVAGIITGPGAPTVFINSVPAAIEGDVVTCGGPPADALLKRATKVYICNKSPARKGDKTAHGAEITTGSPTVNIDSTLQGAALMKAGAPLVQVCEDPNAPESV